MKHLLVGLAAASLLAGCYSGPQGELVGVYPREQWIQMNPYGMNYIHHGSFTMGPSDQDVPFALNTKSKTVTIPAFYMDIHEITNNEYRQFVNYVQDSLFREALAEENEAFQTVEVGVPMEISEYLGVEYLLNWEEPIDMQNEEQFALLFENFYYQGSDRFYNQLQVDSRKLEYRYWWLNLQAASNKSTLDEEFSEVNSLNQLHSLKGHSDRSQFIVEEAINIYPDTLVWSRDFTYGANDHLTKAYFWHPAYDDYPVVGVTWSQARAFNAWRTQLLNEWKNTNGETVVQEFRLPSEAEWEFAARGGLDLSPYPWGGPYTRNKQGCPLANFKPMRGDYVEDGGTYTVPVESYSPNDYGLYQMSGNVAEWTNTSFDETVYDFAHDMSPEYHYAATVNDPPSMHRMVIRGGSWKDIGYYIQTGTRSFEYRDTCKSYIGFRSVMSYLGRGKSESEKESWNDF
jgi:formylglycine-generating enzyme required for sulfatase activity